MSELGLEADVTVVPYTKVQGFGLMTPLNTKSPKFRGGSGFLHTCRRQGLSTNRFP